VLSFKKQDAAH